MKEKNNFSDFLKGFQAQGKPSSTIAIYRDDLQEFPSRIEQTSGEAFSPEKVTKYDIYRYRYQLIENKNIPARDVNRKIALIKVYFDWEIEQGRIEKNPVIEISCLGGKNRWLDVEAYAALQWTIEADMEWIDELVLKFQEDLAWPTELECTKVVRNATLCQVILNTGLELGEALALEPADFWISKTEEIFRVRGDKQRTLPFNAKTWQALVSWSDFMDSRQYIFYQLKTDDEKPMSVQSAQKAIKKIGQKAGIPNLTSGILRNTYRKSLIDQDVPLEKVATLLGESPEITRAYTIPSQQDVEQTVAKLEIPSSVLNEEG